MCACSSLPLRSLEDEIATVHRVVKVLAADVLDAVEVERADVGVVDSTGTGRLDHVGAVRGWQCVQRYRVLALGPGQRAAPDAVRQGRPTPAVAPGQRAGQRALRFRVLLGALLDDGHRGLAAHLGRVVLDAGAIFSPRRHLRTGGRSYPYDWPSQDAH